MNPIPQGYKQTEIGVIPEDWEVKKIGEIAEVIRGASPRPKGDKRYYGGSVPRLMVEDVTRDGKFVTPIVDSLTEAGAKLSRPCPAGTLTIVCSGTVGIPAILEIDACIHDGFLGLIKISHKANVDYLYHFFSTQREKFNNSATHGGVFTNLTTDSVRDFIIALPNSIQEQTAIATALSDVDALISGLESLIAKKQAIKTATMQQLLTGKTRLPQFAHHPDGTPKGTQQTELGEIPEDWGCVSLSECGTFQSGSGFPTKHQGLKEGKYPFFKVSDMNNIDNVKFLKKSNNYISEDIRSLISAKVIPENSIVFAKIGAAIFLERKKINAQSSCIDNNMMAYIANENKLHYEYAHLLFMNISLGEMVEATALPSLSGRDIGQRKVGLPNIEEQSAIAQILSDMDEEIQTLQTRLSKTQQIKQGMMQQLLTGKVRLV